MEEPKIRAEFTVIELVELLAGMSLLMIDPTVPIGPKKAFIALAAKISALAPKTKIPEIKEIMPTQELEIINTTLYRNSKLYWLESYKQEGFYIYDYETRVQDEDYDHIQHFYTYLELVTWWESLPKT